MYLENNEIQSRTGQYMPTKLETVKLTYWKHKVMQTDRGRGFAVLENKPYNTIKDPLQPHKRI